ncbi:MAG: hypothetical protein IJZ44_02165 [Lachnospiraceae bacterium]|nr:hypothetical protein [Lachnospiraceae bacterium]
MQNIVDQEAERVKLHEAAAALGMSINGVRQHMKKNLFKPPIGYVTNPSGRKHQYLIYRKMLDRYINGY